MTRRGWRGLAQVGLAVALAGCLNDSGTGGEQVADTVGAVDGLVGSDSGGGTDIGALPDAAADAGALPDTAGADGTLPDAIEPVDGAEPLDGTTPLDVATDAKTDTGAGTYHPAGWASATKHGMAAKMGDQDCRSCHGADLTGDGPIASCDSCHEAGWRTNCTFCHGGTDNATGAPPQGLDDLDSPLTFPAHSKHVEQTIHGAYDCSQCHKKPTDVLSEGHLFDSTPGKAEIDFSGGLNKSGTFASGSCSSLYCHGNGRVDNGVATVNDAPKTCSSCHPSGTTGINAMSGKHALHVYEGISCWECHQGVLASNGTFVDPTLHVNGVKNPQLPAGITYTGGSCSGTCHGKGHGSKKW